MLAEVEIVVDHGDLAVLADDVGGAGGKPGMLRPGNVVGFLDLRSRGCDREGAAAFLGREIVKRFQVVRGHSDHLGTRLFKIAYGLTKSMGFGGAAARERLGEEIEDQRALLELVGEVELELLAANGASRGEVGCLIADL